MQTEPSAPFDWDKFSNHLEEPDNVHFVQMLQNYQRNLIDIKDEKGFTLLHHAVLCCIPGKVGALIKLVKEF